MSKKITVEPAASSRTGTASADRSFWVVPRRWLLMLAALVCLPWIVIGIVFYARLSGETAPGSPVNATPPEAPAAPSSDPHPWGQLVISTIVISPPLEYVPSNWGPVLQPTWHFPQASREDLAELLTWTGLRPPQVASLVSSARTDARINGLVVTPDPAMVGELAPETRAKLYVQLAQSPLNPRQRDAYRYPGRSADEWLGGAPISPRTRQLIDPLIYGVNGFLYFADIDLIRTQIASPEELQYLAKRLLRSTTLLVELNIDSASEAEAAAEYWGRGGRRTDIRPLLESVASSPSRRIDISHLLPSLAREHLYRYPQISLRDLEKGALVNCFWTALNFFRPIPDDRYLVDAYAIDRLKNDYYIVHDQLQLGDIAAFSGADGNYFHAAVYLADGLVFGKNGNSSLSPWTIIRLDDLKGYYIEYAEDWTVTYYRRKDL